MNIRFPKTIAPRRIAISVFFLLFTISLAENVEASDNSDIRKRWAVIWGEYLSYHVAIDHLFDHRCRAHFPEGRKGNYGVDAAIAQIRNRFPTKAGRKNFDELVGLSFNNPTIQRINQLGRNTIDVLIETQIEESKQLGEICSTLVSVYISLANEQKLTADNATDKLLRKFPNGIELEEF